MIRADEEWGRNEANGRGKQSGGNEKLRERESRATRGRLISVIIISGAGRVSVSRVRFCDKDSRTLVVDDGGEEGATRARGEHTARAALYRGGIFTEETTARKRESSSCRDPPSRSPVFVNARIPCAVSGATGAGIRMRLHSRRARRLLSATTSRRHDGGREGVRGRFLPTTLFGCCAWEGREKGVLGALR